MIDIPKLVGELEKAGDGWGARDVDATRMRDLCRRAAMALREQHDERRMIVCRIGAGIEELGRQMQANA